MSLPADFKPFVCAGATWITLADYARPDVIAILTDDKLTRDQKRHQCRYLLDKDYHDKYCKPRGAKQIDERERKFNKYHDDAEYREEKKAKQREHYAQQREKLKQDEEAAAAAARKKRGPVVIG